MSETPIDKPEVSDQPKPKDIKTDDIEKKDAIRTKYENEDLIKKDDVEITEQQARDTLVDPVKLKEFIKDLEKQNRGNRMKMMDKPVVNIVRMLDKVKGDNDLLKKVIEVHITKDNREFNNGFVASIALDRVQADDKYFQNIYEKSANYHISKAALGRMTDSEFKNKAVLKGIADMGKDVREVPAGENAVRLLETTNYYVARDVLHTVNDKVTLQKVIEMLKDKDDLEGRNASEIAQTRLSELEQKQ